MNHDRPTDTQLYEYKASYITLHVKLRMYHVPSLYISVHHNLRKNILDQQQT